MVSIGAWADVPVAVHFVQGSSKGPNVLSRRPTGQTDPVHIIVIDGDCLIILVGKEGVGRGELVANDSPTYLAVGHSLCAEESRRASGSRNTSSTGSFGGGHQP